MRLVQKYGGTSLADRTCIYRAAERAAKLAKQGHELVLVVSAQGHTTDELLAKAREIDPEARGRELDTCLGAGEQISAALMALALINSGCPAISLTGSQAGIQTDGVFGNGKILHIEPIQIQRAWAAGVIPVVAGFQGEGQDGSLTTLGRGGSDTTAVALAAAVQADTCQIYTDVDGVYDSDPRKNPNAGKYDHISYAQMLVLARNGAQVLHLPSVELAMKHGVPIEVLSAFSDAPGTKIG